MDWISLLLIVVTPLKSPTSWAKAYGGSGIEHAKSIQQTSDTGYIVAGNTFYYGAGGWDILLLKLTSGGNLAWAKTYGGIWDDIAQCVKQTLDGGYIVVGRTVSYGAGSDDFFVLKLTSDGSVGWAKTYGGGKLDEACSVQQTLDSGYIVTGRTRSYGASVDTFDFLVLKLASNGGVEWAKTYGGTKDDVPYSIEQTSDTGYIVAGYTYSYAIAGGNDCWVIKLASNGNVNWSKVYGLDGVDEINSIRQTLSGGYIVAGKTNSDGMGGYDCLVIKLDPTGDFDWAKAYGDTKDEIAYSIEQTSDTGYIVAGGTNSYGGGPGDEDVLIMKLTFDGDIRWSKRFGNISNDDIAYSVEQVRDSGYIVAGCTDVTGSYDFLAIKLESDGSILDCAPLYDCVPNVTSELGPIVMSPSPDTSLPPVSGVDCTPLTSSPIPTVTVICEGSTGVEHKLQKCKIGETKISPNPFTTVIRFKCSGISENQKVSLQIYDSSGRLVKTLITNPLSLATGVTWDGTNERGMACTSGTYLCVIKWDGQEEKKIIYLR